MKKIIIASAIATATAALLSSTASATAFDSVDVPLSGKAQDTWHVIQAVQECSAQPVCQLSLLEEAETLVIFNFVDPAFQEDQSHTAGTTTNYVQGTATDGNPTVLLSETYSPQCTDSQFTVPPTGAGDQACLAQSESSAAITLGTWDVDVDAEGKIIEGYAISDTVRPDSSIISGLSLWADGEFTRFCLFVGPSSSYTPAQVADVANGVTDCAGLATAAGTVFISDTALTEYMTQNASSAPSGKAVPVPAFAAAALGLGLVGVTLLTGRRKRIG